MERWAFAAALVLGTGCTPVAYLQYHGAQGWPTGAGFALYVDKVPVYVGLPNKPYDVVGLIDVYDDKPFFLDDSTKSRVLKLVKDNKGDALIWLNDRTISSGSFRIGALKADPVRIDAGGSTQPEVIVTHGDEQHSERYVRQLRSSLLVIKWK